MTKNNRARTFLKLFAICALIAGFASYGLYKGKDFLTGPIITINSPRDGENISQSLVEITGEAKNISKITLNGRQIFTNGNGAFRENLLLAAGYNIIEVSAKDKFGREVKEKREIILK